MTKDLIQGFEADEGASRLLHSLRDLIQNARQRALRAVDVVQVQTCWEIGRHIVEFEQGGAARAEYGVRLLQILASSLTVEFGRGFDASNLRYMRLFYQAFPIHDALRHELSQSYRSRYCLAHVAAETITEAFTQNNYESKRFGTVPMNCATAAAQLFEK
jgi:hypothetical protein